MEPLRANAGDLLLSDSTEMPGVPLDQMALSPPGHTERVSPKLGTGLSFLALATPLCACAGVGRDGGRGTGKQCRWPHPPSGRSPISPWARQRRKRMEAGTALTKTPAFSILGTYLESRHSKAGF